MELYIADVFDFFGERPFIVGVFDTEEKAWDAIRIVIDRMMEEVRPESEYDADSRFSCYVTPVQLNGFTPACMEWCSCG